MVCHALSSLGTGNALLSGYGAGWADFCISERGCAKPEKVTLVSAMWATGCS